VLPYVHWRFFTRRKCTLLGSIVPLFFSCGGKVEEFTASVPEEQFLSEMTRAICDHVKDCCTKTNRRATNDCEGNVQSQWQPLLDHAHLYGAKYNAAVAARCIESYRYGWSRCRDLKEEHYHLDEACLGLFERLDGPSNVNGPCEFSMDCPLYANSPQLCLTYNGRAGNCLPSVTRKLGEPCGNLPGIGRVECTDDTICGSDTFCIKRPSLGENCGSKDRDVCAVGAICDQSSTETCIKALPFGSPCTKGTDCENYSCVNDRCAPSPDLPGISIYCAR
jgi:hypothetical protein